MTELAGAEGWNHAHADSRARGEHCRACRGSGLLWVQWRSEADGSLTFIQYKRP